VDPRATALVVIDLQRGVVARPAAPHASSDVVARAVRLVHAFRRAGAMIVFVHVGFSADDRDRLKPHADQPAVPAAQMPPDFAEFVDELPIADGDLRIRKRQWGAFYGTELDLQLRRRGVTTLVYTGIATNFGIESTARDAYERGYEQLFVEDAMSGLTAEAHQFAVSTIFPRMGRVVSTDDAIAKIGG